MEAKYTVAGEESYRTEALSKADGGGHVNEGERNCLPLERRLRSEIGERRRK